MRSLTKIPFLWAVALILLNLVIACGNNHVGSIDMEDDSEGPIDYSPGTQLSFGGQPIPMLFDSMSTEQRNLIWSDLALLSGLPNVGYVGNQTAFEIPEFSGQAINPWLYERVKVLFGSQVDFTGRFPEPQGSPLLQTAASMEGFLNSARGALTRQAYAANLGAFVNDIQRKMYKHTNTWVVYTTQIDGVTFNTQSIRNSPFVIIGDSYFLQRRLPVERYVNAIIRLGTLLHEARHSDGKAQYISYGHVACEPIPSSTKKRPAICDFATNGPNAVKREFLKYGRALCRDCNRREGAVLDAAILDSASRVNPSATYFDPSPEVRN